jgi:hypothetical protein
VALQLARARTTAPRQVSFFSKFLAADIRRGMEVRSAWRRDA